jgi:hypothetical protein
MSATSADPIEGLISAVAVRLPGPSRPRAQILAELRDGLLEAAEASERSGLERPEAVRLALDQFGDARTLAASFWPELAAARARRLVIALLATAPIVAALWVSAARSRMPATGRLFDGSLTHAAAALLVGGVIACGVATIAATGRMTRWLWAAPRTPLFGAAATGILAVTADLASLSLLSVPLASYSGSLHQLTLGAAILASATRLTLASRASWACVMMQPTGRC